MTPARQRSRYPVKPQEVRVVKLVYGKLKLENDVASTVEMKNVSTIVIFNNSADAFIKTLLK